MYDIIGDIHGHADKLTALLARLGYRHQAGAWRHPQRSAIFVGDFIDRGPGQLETIGIVRAMLDAGSAQAVMGNHEFNAIGWHTPDPDVPGEHHRRHSAKNHYQHAAFLTETAHDPRLHQELVNWFLDLPVWLDLPGLRVIHACWDPLQVARLAPMLRAGNRLDVTLVEAAHRHGTPEYEAIEVLLKGPEAELPAQMQFTDPHGQLRNKVRLRWWNPAASSFREAAIVDDSTRQQLPDLPMPPGLLPHAPTDKPLFFGHYWETGTPGTLTPRIACVDYSACNGGPLVAYRWDGELDLAAANFVAVH